MKRYAFSPILAPMLNGIPPRDSYRAALVDAFLAGGGNCAAYIPTNPDGTPQYDYALVMFSCVPLSRAQIDGVYIWPDCSADVMVSAIEPGQWQELQNQILARGITMEWVTPQTSYRTLVYGVAQRMSPGFVYEAFDVREVS